jgi:hypothetical protein
VHLACSCIVKTAQLRQGQVVQVIFAQSLSVSAMRR